MSVSPPSLDDLRSAQCLQKDSGTIARRISVHRATTVGPKTPLCQVILRNTSVARDGHHSSSSPASSSASSSINRSMSVLTATGSNATAAAANHSRIRVLAPPRGERARLEALLADVWTRGALPFPGMGMAAAVSRRGGRRGEYLAVKASSATSSMMRKLSVAGIAGSFGRRGPSSSSPHGAAGRWRAGTDVGDGGGDHPHQPIGAGGGGRGGLGRGRRQAWSEPAGRMRRGTENGGGSSGGAAHRHSSSSSALLLSAIPDERSHAPQQQQQAESEWAADVLGTVAAMVDANKRPREETSGGGGGGRGAEEEDEDEGAAWPRHPTEKTVMTSSGNHNKRVKVRRAFSTLKRNRLLLEREGEGDGEGEVRLAGEEKENVCVVETKRGSGKWDRVGGLRGEAVMRGLRSIFH